MARDLFQLQDVETGDTFSFEPYSPERPLDLTGRATIAVHQAPGVMPSQQFMGPGTTEVSFGGALYGTHAWDDHLTLDRMRREGHEHDVVWGPWKKRVRITEASFCVETRGFIRYRLRLIEVHEASSPESQDWRTWQKPTWQAEQILLELDLYELLTRDLRGFLFEFWETLDAVIDELSGLVHDLADLGRFGAELVSQPQRVITRCQVECESILGDLSNAWTELGEAFSADENQSELEATEMEMVNSRLAGEGIYAYLRRWVIRLTLMNFGLLALAGPRRSIRYIVTQGDTLRQIAREELNDPGRWGEIAEANDLDDLELETGQVLEIPVEEAA